MAQAPPPARPGQAPFEGNAGVAPSRRRSGTAQAERESTDRGIPGRRTVTITGRGSQRELAAWQSSARRRPPKRAYERAGTRPDRIAMWAVLMGVLLVLVAATSSHAAVRAASRGGHQAIAALRAGSASSAGAPLVAAPLRRH